MNLFFDINMLQSKGFIWKNDLLSRLFYRILLNFIGLNKDYIEGIFVEKNMRSKGIGKQLLNFVLNGEESINEQNPRAVGFYEYMGVETYILDFHKNIYHKEIEVELLCFKRPEMKFDSLESLSQQMHEDAELARRYAKEHYGYEA